MLVLNVIQELDLYVISTIVIETLHLELIDHVTDLLPSQRLFGAGICQVSVVWWCQKRTASSRRQKQAEGVYREDIILTCYIRYLRQSLW